MMSKSRDIEEISKILGIDAVTSAGGTLTREWLANVLESIGHELTNNDSDKISIAKLVFDKCGVLWTENCSSPGSTITQEYTSKLRQWVEVNIQQPLEIEDLKDEIMEAIEVIYNEAPNKFKPDSDANFEESLFERFGQTWTWLKSLIPIRKAICREKFKFDDKNLDIESIKNFLVDLNINPDLSELDILRSLKIHISSASTHLINYLSSIENGLGEPQAYEDWLEDWEISEDEKETIEPVNAETTTWAIDRFADLARKGELDTDPIYQREFVWEPKQCAMLINSILMGIPLPSVILHEIKVNGKSSYQIIDGKQRITTILRFIGAYPNGVAFMKSKIDGLIQASKKDSILRQPNLNKDAVISTLLSGKDEMGFWSEKVLPRFKTWSGSKTYGLISEEDKKAKRKILPFSLRKDEFHGSIELEQLNNLYYHQMRGIEITVMDKKVPVSDIFENGSSDYRIPVIIYDHKTKAKQIRRVFKRYNTQGAKLNPTEVNNAAYQDLKSMKINLALSRVRPERGEELLRGVYDDYLKTPSVDVEGLYKSWNLSSKRFEWAKLNSVILAILHYRIDRKSNGTHNYPSTSGLIKQYFESEESEEAMTISRIKKLAEFFSNGAKSLLDPLIMEEFRENPLFYHPSSPTNWSQPTAISIMVAAILCESEGVNLSEKIYDEDILTNFSDFVSSNQSLGQTQADGQWRYYAKIIVDLCAVFGLTKDNFSDRESLFDGYNLLEYLNSIPPEVLE
jgi:hypothetical protein